MVKWTREEVCDYIGIIDTYRAKFQRKDLDFLMKYITDNSIYNVTTPRRYLTKLVNELEGYYRIKEESRRIKFTEKAREARNLIQKYKAWKIKQ